MDLAEEDGFSRPDYQLHLFLEDFQLSLLFAIYSSEIKDSKTPSPGAGELNGYIIQSICVYKFKKSYLDCTPIFIKNSYSNNGNDDFVLEGNYLYMIKPNKMQIGCFARRYFRGNSTTLRAALRIYF